MPIISSDIKTRLSVTTGSAGNSVAQTDPNASLGKYLSTTDWAGGTLHDLFDLISQQENAASTADYRAIFLYNTHSTLTFLGIKVWISAQTAGGASISIGVDPTAASNYNAAPVQAVTAGSETTAPAGVTFSAPTTEGTGISVGDLAPGKCRAIWVKRLAANTTGLAVDGATLSISGGYTS